MGSGVYFARRAGSHHAKKIPDPFAISTAAAPNDANTRFLMGTS